MGASAVVSGGPRTLLLAAKKTTDSHAAGMKVGERVCKVTFGGDGVSGTVFCDNAEYRKWVFEVWKAECLDMESTAIAQVCWENKRPCLIVRGLSDLAGGQAGANQMNDLSQGRRRQFGRAVLVNAFCRISTSPRWTPPTPPAKPTALMNVEVVLTHPGGDCAAATARPERHDLRGFRRAAGHLHDSDRSVLTARTASYPAATVAEALALREASGWPDALLGGERGGVKIDGFDLGNSPREYTVGGRRRARHHHDHDQRHRGPAGVRGGTRSSWREPFLNLRALAEYLSAHRTSGDPPRAGLRWHRRAFRVGGRAGGRGADRSTSGRGALDDAGRRTMLRRSRTAKRRRHNLLGALQRSENGRRLTEIGLDGDLEWCARESPLPLVRGDARRGADERRKSEATLNQENRSGGSHWPPAHRNYRAVDLR